MTRRWTIGAVALTAVAAGACAALAGGKTSPSAKGGAQSPSTARVERGPLASVVSMNGTLTYRAGAGGSPYVAINRARGTYTALPRPGDRRTCGDTLYRVDDRPVLLLCGTVPAYRDLAIGATGGDVRELSATLHARGADRRAGVAVDPRSRRFSWQTGRALRQLQRERGSSPTGRLDLGAAVVLPGAVRIAKVAGALGGDARPGARILEATTGTLEVQVALDPARQDEVRAGDRARITLPGSRLVRGTVGHIGTVAQAPADGPQGAGAATIPASIRLDDPARAGGLDHAPVRVEIRTRGVDDVLSVPVLALVGRAGGGDGVEVVRPGGRREVIAVRTGLFDPTGGRVQVEGELRAGDAVVVPAS